MFKKYFLKNELLTNETLKVIEAVQFTNEYKDRIFNSLTGQTTPDFENGEPIIKLKTLNNQVVNVYFGDWIIKDEQLGTYYVFKDEIFKSFFK